MNANLTIMLLAMCAGAWAFLQLIAKARQEALDEKNCSELQALTPRHEPSAAQKVPEVFGDR